MALHGPVMVNGVAIGEWGAQRTVMKDDPAYDEHSPMPYLAQVWKRGRKVWEGRIDPTPSDGPFVLAAKVLLNG